MIFRPIITEGHVAIMAVEGKLSPGCAEMDSLVSSLLEDLGIEAAWWVARVFVRPEYRRRGVGRKLVRQMLEHAGGLPVIVCPGGYGEDPEDQVAFYKALGFVDTSVEGALIWEKSDEAR